MADRPVELYSAPTGYRHPLYAQSFAQLGEPVELPRSGGWIIRREVSGSDAHDAMGCYPLLCCTDWSGLRADLAELEHELVTLVVVLDPLASVTESMLEGCFDIRSAFKQHYAVELTRPLESFVSRHHRRYARRALENVEVYVHPDPPAFTDAWTELYRHLIQRRQLTGLQAFSHAAFAMQLEVPGTFLLVAESGGEVVGADWYYLDGSRAYAHLAAFSERGYETSVSYGLQWRALEWLSEAGVQIVNLGGAPGRADPSAADGLHRFKRGWSTGVLQADLAARIFDRPLYDQLSAGAGETDYVPAYRVHEPL